MLGCQRGCTVSRRSASFLLAIVLICCASFVLLGHAEGQSAPRPSELASVRQGVSAGPTPATKQEISGPPPDVPETCDGVPAWRIVQTNLNTGVTTTTLTFCTIDAAGHRILRTN